MISWKKMGLLLDLSKLPNMPDWFHEFAQAPNSVQLEDRIRVFFCCRGKPDSSRQFVSRAAYFDVDRDDPTKLLGLSFSPVLELGGLGAFDEFGTYPFSVVKHENEIHAFYGGWTRCESTPFNISIGRAISLDEGKSFARTGAGPVLSHSVDEPFVVTSPKIRRYRDTWYLTYTAGRKWFIADGRPEIIYKLRMAYSSDGINWTRLGKDIIENKLGEDEAQACGDIIYANSKFHMFFCYREATDFRFNVERTYRIGYASSVDLFHWERDDSKAGIDVSKSGWDSQMVAYPHIFQAGSDYYMLYQGNEVGRYGMGIAKLEGRLE